MESKIESSGSPPSQNDGEPKMKISPKPNAKTAVKKGTNKEDGTVVKENKSENTEHPQASKSSEVSIESSNSVDEISNKSPRCSESKKVENEENVDKTENRQSLDETNKETSSQKDVLDTNGKAVDMVIHKDKHPSSIRIEIPHQDETPCTITSGKIVSPPKSEIQTDDTNTATSSSPGSESQLSPMAEEICKIVANPLADCDEPSSKIAQTAESPSTHPSGAHAIQQPIDIVANGSVPKSGKPLMSAMNKKLNKSPRSARPRKQKALVAMYESEISDNKVGIKLCIKKSDASSNTVAAVIATTTPTAVAAKSGTSGKNPNRKRSRKSKTKSRVDSDDSEYEAKRKKDRTPNNNIDKPRKVSFSGIKNDVVREPIEQGVWGAGIPEEILLNIFQIVVDREGCLPTLFGLGRVCSLWRRVSLSSSLWKVLDLSTWIKEKYRTEPKLKWFVDNRCTSCTELNASHWKVSDINCFLHKLAKGCPNLAGITLAGWKGFTSDHLAFLVDNMKALQRIDLSSINVEMNTSKSAVNVQSLCNALQTMNGRLTHLYLAHNRLAGIPQIVNILSAHCPNLILLDLSNVSTQATSHGILHIEKLQNGCKKLKVLRVTNSHVTLSTASMQEMMDSPGFPELEELSVAALTDESRIFGDEHLQRILKTSSKLSLLDVRGCTRLTHESLIRLPAWDIKHLFLSGCSVTRDVGSGLELIASKWAHSLTELDLAWANVQQPLDNALRALSEKGSDSPLAHLNLCGSSVSEEAVKDILANCAQMSSINLSSCRGLPRGVKRLMQGPHELQELRDVLKVQMKVKLPAKQEQDQKEEPTNTQVTSDNQGGGQENSQSN